jgi:hypothetical protein
LDEVVFSVVADAGFGVVGVHTSGDVPLVTYLWTAPGGASTPR